MLMLVICLTHTLVPRVDLRIAQAILLVLLMVPIICLMPRQKVCYRCRLYFHYMANLVLVLITIHHGAVLIVETMVQTLVYWSVLELSLIYQKAGLCTLKILLSRVAIQT